MYFEEYQLGTKYELPPVSLTEEEIIDFALEYDPRDIHIDEEKAKKSRFGGIIASGFHTLIACWAPWVKTKIDADHLISGMQLNEVKWLQPVYPGDELKGVIEIVDLKEHSNGKTGAVTYRLLVHNQKKEKTLDMSAIALVSTKKGGE